MRLAVVSTVAGPRVVRVEGDRLHLTPFPSVAEMLTTADWRTEVSSAPAGADELRLHELPVAGTGRIICVGLNDRGHVSESGKEIAPYPTLFAKYPSALTGSQSDIVLPAVSDQVDWEAELGVVVGCAAYRIPESEAWSCVAGLTCVNDISMRDWQRRTSEWLPGKNFDSSTPVGPVMVTLDEFGDGPPDLKVSCHVDGVLMQESLTSDLIFGVADVLAYISQFMALQPGDLVAMGTSAGVAARRPDKPFLRDGQVVRVAVEGVGECVNRFVSEKASGDRTA